MSTLSHACSTVCSFDCLERYFNCGICIEPSLIDKVVQSLLVEDGLYSAENCFDGIKLRAVSDIENGRDAELFIHRLYQLRFVHGKLIHKQCERPAMLSFELSQKMNELLGVDCLGVNLYVVDAILLSHRSDHRTVPSINLLLIDCEVGVLL